MISLHCSDRSRALIYIRSPLRQSAQFCCDTLVIGCKLPAYSCMHHYPAYQCRQLYFGLLLIVPFNSVSNRRVHLPQMDTSHSFCCSVLSLWKPLIENGEEEGMWIHLLLRCLLFICSMWGGAGLVYNVTEYLFSHGINIENLETHTEQVPTSLDSQCFWCDCGP
jgi:hypothetical protein